MTITYAEFIEQLATLYAFGLPEKDDWEVKYWYRPIESEKLTKDKVEAAILRLTKTTTKFWDTDNIPAMIIETAAQIQTERNQAALSKRLQLEDARAKAERKQIEESYGGTEEERQANRAKIQKLLKECLR